MNPYTDETNKSENDLCSLKNLDDVSSDFVSFENRKTNIEKNDQFDENKSYEIFKGLDIIDESQFTIKFITFLNHLQKIIKEDKDRFEIFEKRSLNSSESLTHLSSINDDFRIDMLPEDIEIAMDKLKQNIINKFYLYFSKLRDMDVRIMQLEDDKINFQELIKLKTAEIEKLEKLKKLESPNDSKEKYKSLGNDFINRRRLIELDNLKEELKVCEKDFNVLREEKKKINKENRQLKLSCEEMKTEHSDILIKLQKSEMTNKNLKRQMEDLRNENSNYEKTISDKDELICTLKENTTQENKLNLLSESFQIEQSSISMISEKDDEINRLNEEIKNLNEQLTLEKQKPRKMDTEKCGACEKKDVAIANIRQKYDTVLENNRDLELEKLKLTTDLNSSEAEMKKKQDAIISLRDKIKNSYTIEKKLENMNQIEQQLSFKEHEIKKMLKEKTDLEDNLQNKTREMEVIKKENRAHELEINNLKLMISKNKTVGK